MEQFRKKLQARLWSLISMCLMLPITYWTMHSFTENVSDFAQGLLLGLFISIMAASVVFLVDTFVTLRNEERLKKAYVKATDERNAAIAKETMRTAGLISMMVTAIAVIVTGFLSMTVSLTLFADMAVGALITLLVHAYYNKKM